MSYQSAVQRELPLRSGQGPVTEAWSDQGLIVSIGRKAVARVVPTRRADGSRTWSCVNIGASCARELPNQGEAVLMARRIAALLIAGTPRRAAA